MSLLGKRVGLLQKEIDCFISFFTRFHGSKEGLKHMQKKYRATGETGRPVTLKNKVFHTYKTSNSPPHRCSTTLANNYPTWISNYYIVHDPPKPQTR
jgi:hypothetical protein